MSRRVPFGGTVGAASRDSHVSRRHSYEEPPQPYTTDEAEEDSKKYSSQIRDQSAEVSVDGCLGQALRFAFGGDDVDEMNVDSVEFSLICPYSKTRMVTPVSCTACSHIQCMELASAIRVLVNGKSRKDPIGVCPRCGKPVRLSQLYINPWMTKLLSSLSADQVVLTPDGNVKPKTVERQRDVFDCSQDLSTIIVKPEPGLNIAGPSSLIGNHRQSEGGRIFSSEGMYPPSGHMSQGSPTEPWAIADWDDTPQIFTPSMAVPDMPKARRLNRSFVGRQWVPLCTKCGRKCTEHHDPSTGIVEEGCCGVVAPRSAWILQHQIGRITLRLHPDDLLFIMGDGADAFGCKLIYASFSRAEALSPMYFGFIDSFTRFDLDYLMALCSAAPEGPKACSAITPVPDLFRDWLPRRPGSTGYRGMSQAPSYTQSPFMTYPPGF